MIPYAWHVDYRASDTAPWRTARFRAAVVFDSAPYTRALAFMRGIDSEGGTASMPHFEAINERVEP